MSYMPPEFAHAPMLITHFGSSICSYRRCTTGAIFMKQVPAITIKSAWRGDARLTSAPNRARSWVGVHAVAISTYQHDRPKLYGQIELLRPQLTATCHKPSSLPGNTFLILSPST